MLLRRSAAPKELLAQAGAAEESARAVMRYFEEPSDSSASAAAKAAASAVSGARAAESALKALPRGPVREDWLAILRSLSELSEFAARAAAKAKALGARPRPEFRPLSRDLLKSASALKQSLASGAPRVESLVEGKRRGSGADVAARALDRAALEEPRFVEELKDREVLHWLCEAANAAQEAAERLAEVMGQQAR